MEKEWAEACWKYNKKMCKMIEEKGHELGTHTHNYPTRTGIQEGDSFDIREIVTVSDSKFIPYNMLDEDEELFERTMNELLHISCENEAIKIKK